jgi:hypothetical protein
MLKSLKQIAAKDGFPFIVMAVLLALFHIPLNTNFGDDLMGREIWNSGQTVETLIEFWNAWLSRVVIGFVSLVFSGLPQICWKIANVCMTVLAAVCVSKLFAADTGVPGAALTCGNRRVTRNIIIVSLFLMYNIYEMSSTGWIAATTNYLWPAAMSLYVLLSVKKTYAGEKLKIYEYPLTVAALIFAANSEQACGIFLLIYIFLFAKRAAAARSALPKMCFSGLIKHLGVFVLLQFFLCVASLTYILLCPGNSLRYEAEAARWFPNHHMLTFFEKISIGISSTFNYFVLMPNVLFLVLSLLLAAGVIAKYKNPLIRAAAITPFLTNIAALGYVFADYFMADGSFTLKNPRDIFHLYGIIGAQEGPRFIIPHVFYITMICTCTANLYLLFKGAADKFIMSFGVLLLGISSRVMLGLSPTVFASSYRTYLFLNISFIITALIVYQEIIKLAAPKTVCWINALMVVTAVVNFLALPFGYQIVKPFFGRL